LQECLDRNLQAARLTNPDVVAVGIALNTSGLTAEQAVDARTMAEDALGLPCEDPVATGVRRIVDRLLEHFEVTKESRPARPVKEPL
jgi:uncharacterized NAD-dependent epimerase/dehydratase family protein